MKLVRTTSAAISFAVLAAVFGLGPSQVAARQADAGEGCSYAPDSTVDVLLLLDQSGSLRRTDPEAQRVPGARAVVNAFASLSYRVAGVRILVAGFGTDFEPDDWTRLTEETTSDVLTHVESFRERNRDLHTDYAEAMHGVVGAFSASQASCKLLYWFTDGEHDLDRVDARLREDGLARSYLSDDPTVVTLDNLEEIEARMSLLICGDGGYADRLGEIGVRVEVRLLGSGEDMDSQSRRVLEGMGGNPARDCGPGNGFFANVEEASDLPYELACSSQFGTLSVPLPRIDEDGTLTITNAEIDNDKIPAYLVVSLRLFAVGFGGPPAVVTEPPGMVTRTDETDVLSLSVDRLGEEFRIDLSNVEQACLFVTGEDPRIEVTQATPTLYQGEPGEFSVLVFGPYGEITGPALDRIRVEPSHGEVVRTGTRNVIRVASMPPDTFSLTVTVTAGQLSSTRPADFKVNEPSNGPRIEAPQPIEGEGTGPFVRQLRVDGRDGGTLCLEKQTATFYDDEGDPLDANATFDGEKCVEVAANSDHRIDLEIIISRQANADALLEFHITSTSNDEPPRSAPGVLPVDLKVLPLVNTGILMVIVAAILLILIGLLWAVLYGVNRLVARIPDVRKNRVRFGEFTARLTSDDLGRVQTELVQSPKDAELRVPRATASQLKAGRLTLRRRVPIRPWVPPGAELSFGTEVVAARIGSGASHAVVIGDKRLRTRSRVALGPLVAIGVAKGQLERLNETAQSVNGVVLFDARSARGQDAGGVVADLIRTGLGEIGARLATTEGPRGEGTTRR